jgi:tetratricopeptide (TPR) repeat protein
VNTRRLIGLIVLTLFASWLALRSCTSEAPPPPAPPEPAREAFHAAKPLRAVVAIETNDASSESPDLSWLEREVRFLLVRGQMRLASNVERETSFVLRIGLTADQARAHLRLVAPDEIVEREQTIELGGTRLATMQALAKTLPAFLDASHASQDWAAFIGITDERAYDAFVRAATELFGPTAQGLTRPVTSRARVRAVERLESLTRAQPNFPRGWATLATAYLSLGGEDLSSLTHLAGSAAERALRLDDATPEAHAALGMVDLRNNEWLAAEEKFERALAIDADVPSAVEGLACLYADSGHFARSLPHAIHAVSLQPRNVGANECLTYAQIGTNAAQQSDESMPTASVARVRALAAFLEGDRRVADRLLRATMPRAEFEIWAAPTLQAAANRRLVPEGLKAITQAANDGYIDAATEILCGAALKQPEFVFNRIARLAREEQHAPLRVLWLPKADFLRKHPRFEEAVSEAGLTTFWHASGPPDVCAQEPDVYGCNLKARE